jgi:hypothetical protein
MSVDANTGVLTWKPTSSQLGTCDISLNVADNRGIHSTIPTPISSSTLLVEVMRLARTRVGG